jgi:hypothetical protein
MFVNNFFTDVLMPSTSEKQNYWVFGLRPSFGILETRKQHFGNWFCFRPQASGGDTYSVGSLRES